MVWQHKGSLPKRSLKIFCPREVLVHDADYFYLINQTILCQSMRYAISLTVWYRFLNSVTTEHLLLSLKNEVALC